MEDVLLNCEVRECEEGELGGEGVEEGGGGGRGRRRSEANGRVLTSPGAEC